MRIEWEIGLYEEHFEKILKWYNLAFKDKHPTKEDETVFDIIKVLHMDLKRQGIEETNDE